MRRSLTSTLVAWGAVLMLLAAVLTACELVEPDEEPHLVVEAFLESERPAPALRLSKTGDLDAPYRRGGLEGVGGDADVRLRLGEETITYEPEEAREGYYHPTAQEAVARPGMSFEVTARWDGREARAKGHIPPPVSIDSIRIEPTEEPIRAVFLDSLFLDPVAFDSLRADGSTPGTPEEGYAYAVEVTLWWTAPPDTLSGDYWVRSRLRPELPDGSALDDFFLRTEQIQPEEHAACNETSGRTCEENPQRAWTGVYGIPVDGEEAPFPAHRLRVALIRSGEDYAHFASTRRDPARREPASNVTGGLGIAAGIALDSLGVEVE